MHTLTPSDLDTYTAQYTTLRAWVRGSLPTLRPQLARVLWPLYVLGVATEQQTDSNSFAETFRADHELEHGAQVAQLVDGDDPDSLIAFYTRRAHPVRMSATAAQLLVDTMTRAQLDRVLAVLNAHVDVQLVDSLPAAPTTPTLHDDVIGGPVDVGLLPEVCQVYRETAVQLRKAIKDARAAKTEPSWDAKREALRADALGSPVEVKAARIPLPLMSKQSRTVLHHDLISCF